MIKPTEIVEHQGIHGATQIDLLTQIWDLEENGWRIVTAYFVPDAKSTTGGWHYAMLMREKAR